MGWFSRRRGTAFLPLGEQMYVQVWDHRRESTLPRREQWFTLEREPSNDADPNAIRVLCDTGWIGYFSADDAERYAAVLDLITLPIRVRAMPNGDQTIISIPAVGDLRKWATTQKWRMKKPRSG